MNIEVIKSSKRVLGNDIPWLSTYYLFSFANYLDPQNTSFGPLRVFNDDTIKGKSGFDMHPHRDMEIITVVLEGKVTHKDSMHNMGIVAEFEAQAMTAGTGVTHSEHNLEGRPLKLYQVWFTPNAKNLTPSYSKIVYSKKDLNNTLFPIASNIKKGKSLKINSDATFYRAIFQNNHRETIKPSGKLKYFIYVTDGIIKVNDKTLRTKDQARIITDKEFTIESSMDNSDFILIEMADI